MGREENVAIFEDTLRLCKENKHISDLVRKSLEGQTLIKETDTVTLTKGDLFKYYDPANIIVSKRRSFEASERYLDKNVCVLNFASATNPGGGVERGANAQEECLCRCSGLYPCLKDKKMWEGFYKPHRTAADPLHNDDIIFTPDVLVFKSDTSQPQLVSDARWHLANVITCAAPNLREKPNKTKSVKISDKELLAIHEKRLRRILDVAAKESVGVMILGAFGCGAFANNPEVVARAAKNVIKDYLYAFQAIEFAVYCDPKDERNYEVFKRVLQN